MQSKQINQGAEKTFLLVLETGDEVITELTQFAKQHALSAGHFTAIGAFNEVTLGYFDWATKAYQQIPISEQVEVLAFVGDIALENDSPKIHAHVVVGKRDGSAHGGHLMRASVRPTLEVIVSQAPAHLQRVWDPSAGLALIRL